MKRIVAVPVLSLVWLLVSGMTAVGGEKVGPVSGTYKDALRKAGEAGKPLMLFFWHDSYVDCKREWAQMEEIPETMRKFVLYRINGEQNPALAKQFDIPIFPSLIFLKPNGEEFHRQTSIYETAEGLRNELQRVLEKGGPIAKAFQQIVSKYPGSKAAEQAQEQLDELEPKASAKKRS
jgi:thioredoxin-like negative regulator of GroEL